MHLSPSSASWRIPLGLQIVPALILAVGILFFPFSPRWLMANGRESEAMAVLMKIRSGSQRDVLIEYNEIKQEITLEREQSVRSYSQLFRFPLRRRLILGIGIQILQQLTGINSIMYYAPEIFKQAGLSGQRASLLATGINGCVNVVATIPAILFLDKWGRRPVLISGAILMSLSMLTIGSVIGVHGYTLVNATTGTVEVIIPSQTASYIAIMFVYVFVAAFAFSWGPTTWLYCAEIFPMSMRAKGTSLTTAAIWATNCLVSFLVPVLLERITYGTYLIFGILCISMAVLAFVFYPETKGRSLEDMDLVFGRSVLAISLGKKKKKKNIGNSNKNRMLEFKQQRNGLEQQPYSNVAVLNSHRVTYF
jgi:sugar porter (SP) family MFS transporter